MKFQNATIGSLKCRYKYGTIKLKKKKKKKKLHGTKIIVNINLAEFVLHFGIRSLINLYLGHPHVVLFIFIIFIFFVGN